MSIKAQMLGRSMAKGAAWMVAMRFAIRGIGLISIAILARLLMPEDFGLVALATVLAGALSAISEFSFDVVLIQNQNADRRHYDTAWTLSIIRNAVMALTLAVFAAPISAFFEEPRLEVITYWLALATFVEGFANIGVVNFRKDLQFHKEFAFMVVTKGGMFAVTVPLAVLWRDYWALVAGIVAGAFIRMALSYLMHPYRARLSLAEWRAIMGFSKWLLLNSILFFLFYNSATFIIGKFAGARSLGLYAIAYEFANLAASELVAPIRRATFPGHAKLAADPDLLRKSFVDMVALIVTIAFPVAVGIGLTADLLVYVFLGERWLDSIELIQVLVVFAIINLFSENVWPIYIVLGRPQIVSKILAICIIAFVPLLVWAVVQAGAYGAAWAVTGAASLLFVLNVGTVLRILKISIGQIVSQMWRILFAALGMAAVVLMIRSAWPVTEHIVDKALLLGICIAAGSLTHFGVQLALWRLGGRPNGPEKTILAYIGDRLAGNRLARKSGKLDVTG